MSLSKLHNHRFHEDHRRRGFYDIVPHLAGDMNVTHVPRGSIAGMHMHKQQTDYFMVAQGAMLFRLMSDEGDEEWITLSSHSRQTLIIEPGIWHGYKALEDSVVVFYIDHKFNTADEYKRETDRREWEFPIK